MTEANHREIQEEEIKIIFNHEKPLVYGIFLWLLQFTELLRKHLIASYRCGWITFIFRLLFTPFCIFIYLILSKYLKTPQETEERSIESFVDQNEDILLHSIKEKSNSLNCPGSSIFCYPTLYFTPINHKKTDAIINSFVKKTGMKVGIDIFGFEKSKDVLDIFEKEAFEMGFRRNNYLVNFTFDEIENTVYYSMKQLFFYSQTENIFDYDVQNFFFLLKLDEAIGSTNNDKSIPMSFIGEIKNYKKKQTPSTSNNNSNNNKNEDDFLYLLIIIIFSSFTINLLGNDLILWDMNERIMTRMREFNMYETSYWSSIFTINILQSFIATIFFQITLQLSSTAINLKITDFVFCFQYFLYVFTFSTISLVFVTLGRSKLFASVFNSIYPVGSIILAILTYFTEFGNFSKFYDYLIGPIFPSIYIARVFRTYYEIYLKNKFNEKYSSNTNIVTIVTIILIITNIVGFFSCVILGQILGRQKKSISKSFPFSMFAKKPAANNNNIKNKNGLQLEDSSGVLLENISKKFGKFLALDNVSLKLQKGVISALLGHNGSGKSTLIDILTGVITQSGGNGIISGEIIGTRKANELLGVCPQTDAIYPYLSASEHLRLFCCLRGLKRTKEMKSYVEKLLSLVSLGENKIGNRAVGKFSGGMRRRLSIVSALVGNPKVLIFDEPTTGLDPINRKQIWDFFLAAKNSATIIFTSHSNQEVEVLADDVVVLASGKVVLQQNYLALKQSNAIEIQVTLRKDTNCLKNTGVLIISTEHVHSNVYRIKIEQKDFVTLCCWLESNDVFEWQQYSSMKELLPPQPGTNEEQQNLVEEEIIDHTNTERVLQGTKVEEINEKWKLTKDFKPKFIYFNQIIGLFIKHWQIQICGWKSNVFLVIIVILYIFSNLKIPVKVKRSVDKVSNINSCSNTNSAGCFNPNEFKIVSKSDNYTFSITENQSPKYYKLSKEKFKLTQSSSPFFKINLKVNENIINYELISSSSNNFKKYIQNGEYNYVSNILPGILYEEIGNKKKIIFRQFGESFKRRNYLDIFYFLGGICLILFIWFLFPVFARQPLMEKKKYKSFLKVQGLLIVSDVLAHYFFCIFYSIPIILIFTIVSNYYQKSPFINLFLALIFEVHYIIGFALLYGNILASLKFRNIGTLISYLLPLVVVGINALSALNAIIFESSLASLFIPGRSLFVLYLLNFHKYGFHYAWNAYFALFMGGSIFIICSVLYNIGFQVISASFLKFVLPFLTKTTTKKKPETKNNFTLDKVQKLISDEEKRVRSPNNDLVVLDSISKNYGSNAVIFENITMGIDAGEGFGLLGANGTGKSHLVKIITKQIQASKGNLISPDKNEIGLIPQDSILEEELSVAQNLCFFARLRGMNILSSRREAFLVAKIVGLQKFMNRKVNKLSGGMKRRIAIAISLLGGPLMIVADEPTSALDVHHKENIWKIFVGLRDHSGITVFLVTHEMDEVQYVAKRVAVLHNELRFIGTINEMKNLFNGAWRLVLQCRKNDSERIKHWVSNLGHSIKSTYGGGETSVVKFEYQLNHSCKPQELSILARKIEKEYGRMGITDWCLTPLSLEDAFINSISL